MSRVVSNKSKPKEEHLEKEAFTLYRTLPLSIRKDKSLLQVPKDPQQFVSSFVQAVAPGKRLDGVDKISSRREMIMDAMKPRKRKEKRRRRRALTNKQRKDLNMNKIPTEQQKYEMYEPLHQLWLDYMRDSLQLNRLAIKPENLHPKLLRCDFHGSLITVTKSKCPSYIGQSGIVIQESRNTFKMVTKADVIRTIPKAGTVFTLTIDSLVVNIYGNHIKFRAGDRANKKFKMKPTIDL